MYPSDGAKFWVVFNSGFAETNEDSSGVVVFEEGEGPSEEHDTIGKMYNDSDDEDDDTVEPATPITRAIAEDADGLVIVRKESDDVATGNDEDEDGRLAHGDEASSLTKDDSNSEPSILTEAPEVSLSTTNRLLSVEQNGDIGPKKRRIIVKDVAYTTYHAVLYWASTYFLCWHSHSSELHYSFTRTGLCSRPSLPPSRCRTKMLLLLSHLQAMRTKR